MTRTCPPRVSRAAVAALLVSAAGSAQMRWVLEQPATSPPPRFGHAMVYDSGRQRVVMFGGGPQIVRPGGPRGDTWEWDGTTWIERTPATNNPPWRVVTAMAYDSRRARVVLFSGAGERGHLGDTWEWDGAAWTQLRPATEPSPREGHAMVYDEERGRVVMFGGNGVGAETWEWDGSDWTMRVPRRSPPPGAYDSMVYDSARRRVVLFSGWGSGAEETWEWNGTSWTLRRPAQAPPDASWYSMAYDRIRERTVYLGDAGAGGGDTWEWDGAQWTQRLLQQRPPAVHWGAATAYDEVRGTVVLFGGRIDIRTARFSDETWTYRPTVPGAAVPIGFPCRGVAGAPLIGNVGPSIVGNARFEIRLGQLAPESPAFLAASPRLGNHPLGGCTIYPEWPFAVVLWATSSASGNATFEVPIPFEPSLSGGVAVLQGGAIDAAGALFGALSLTAGLVIRIGD